MLETAELLLALLLAHPAPPTAAVAGRAANARADPAAPYPLEGLAGCATSLSATAAPAGAFLAGGASVPAALLARVPPALLARLMRGLTPPADTPVLPVRWPACICNML